MKNLIKQFTSDATAYTKDGNIAVVGQFNAQRITFNDNRMQTAVLFYRDETPLFFMDESELINLYHRMSGNSDVFLSQAVELVLNTIEPLFNDAEFANGLLNDYNVVKAFKDLQKAFENVLSLYENFDNQAMLNVCYPFDMSFDEINVHQWSENAEIMNEFAVEIIKIYNLA